MNQHPVKLLIHCGFKDASIISDSINAYKNVPLDFTRAITVVEGNDVGQGLMFEVLLVECEEVIVRAENVIDSNQALLFPCDYFLDPVTGFAGFHVELFCGGAL